VEVSPSTYTGSENFDVDILLGKWSRRVGIRLEVEDILLLLESLFARGK